MARIVYRSYGSTGTSASLGKPEAIAVALVGTAMTVGLVVLAVAESWGVLGWLSLPFLAALACYAAFLFVGMTVVAVTIGAAVGGAYLLWLGVTVFLPRVATVAWAGAKSLVDLLVHGAGGAALSGEFVDLALANVATVALSGLALGMLVGWFQSRGRVKSRAAEAALSEVTPGLLRGAPEAVGGFFLNVIVGFLVGAFAGAAGATGPLNWISRFGASPADVLARWDAPIAIFGGTGGPGGGTPADFVAWIWGLLVLLLAVLALCVLAGVLFGLLVAAVQGAILGVIKGTGFSFAKACVTTSADAARAAGGRTAIAASMAEGARTGATCGAVLGLVHGIASVVARAISEAG